MMPMPMPGGWDAADGDAGCDGMPDADAHIFHPLFFFFGSSMGTEGIPTIFQWDYFYYRAEYHFSFNHSVKELLKL